MSLTKEVFPMTEPGADKRRSTPPEAANDRFARESFTFRRMRPWQITAMTGVLAVLLVLAIVSWMA
ncbi:hypothetical protein LMTR13_12545 [Bradyrhizobium icense]|uniref:Uncharacterized protein n=1 Tax=Bradyrhizobium icense TaxID=1274631 RepID=A0A1B1UDM7_9BRAD|nr:hypothetical protein LMTR13_12545 [Bradyrhizobium icense]